MAYLPPLPPHLNEDAFWEDNNNPFRDLHQPMPRPPFVPDDDDWEAVPVAFGRSREADNMRFGEIPASLLQGTWTRQQCIDHVVNIFPDISLDHVANLHQRFSARFVDQTLCQVCSIKARGLKDMLHADLQLLTLVFNRQSSKKSWATKSTQKSVSSDKPSNKF